MSSALLGHSASPPPPVGPETAPISPPSRPNLNADVGVDVGHGHFGADAHIVQFYQDDQFLIQSVGEFLRAGIRAGEPVLVVATASHRAALAAELTRSGIHVTDLTDRGLLTMFDAKGTLAEFLVDGKIDRERFRKLVEPVIAAAAARSATGSFRAYGEMVNLLWDAGNPEAAILLEELWNELARAHSFLLLCGYAMNNFRHEHDARGFAEVCRSHSRVVPTESYFSLADSDSRSREISLLQQRAQALHSEVERRKQVEEALRAALRVRDDFLCVAGHELRTPLTVLRLQLASLLSRSHAAREPRTERRLAALITQTERLTRLAERMLDVSQMGDTLALQVRDVNLTDLVRDGVASCADAAGVAGCQLRLVVDPDVTGRWDADRIDQVLQDLLSNAIKFGRGAAVHVQVRALPHRAELVVRSGGMGIPLEDQERIFDRFERCAPTESFGGLGLGLWIARQVAEAHGGEIRVVSAPGQGATFTVSLPYEPPPQGARS